MVEKAVVTVNGLQLIDEAIRQYNPRVLFGLMSGGHDSLCATHLASQHPLFGGVVHINTGIGIEQTRDFVRDVCDDNGWTLYEYHPPVPYDQIVKEYGFPGPTMHSLMYNRLKERGLRQLTREHKTEFKDRILLASGVRSLESTRRMGTTEPINKDGARVWVAPIHNWSNHDKNWYMTHHKLPRNQVVDLLHMSGECLCGAFARPGEREELRMWYPNVVEEIEALEREVEQIPKLRGKCRWGQMPKDPDQMEMAFMPMCSSCVDRPQVEE